MTRIVNLGDLFPQSVDREKTAVIDLGTGSARQFTYGALDTMARGIARALMARGFARGDRIAILSANRAEYLAALFGIMRAGLVAVPVSFRLPRETIHFIIADSDAKLVFCDSERRAEVPDIPVVEFDGDGADALSRFTDDGPFDALLPRDREPALFLYTSGSTGVPKGVILSHQAHTWVVQTRIGGQDLSRHRYLIAAPLYHMNALCLSQLVCAAGATIVLLPQFTPASYIEAISRWRCTWLTAVPPMIAMMLRHHALQDADLSSVQNLRMGSAPVSESLMRAIRRVLPKANITNAYGSTEGGPVVFAPHPGGLRTPDLSVGVPHPAVQVRLVDGANRNAEQGVLEMKCPALMNGYHNRPQIVPPFTEDGFYVTGDIFRRDGDGFHFFVGRNDDMFVSGGENIYPGEVERVLERHPSVAQACVVPIDDEIKGTKPVAFVVRTRDGEVDEAEVKTFALAHAPAFQHPRFVWFLDRLPLTSTNKIDRRALMQLAAERLTHPGIGNSG
jgi:acyl-CoA synthetase (AMP-forming)/AMP-acid ligase II